MNSSFSGLKFLLPVQKDLAALVYYQHTELKKSFCLSKVILQIFYQILLAIKIQEQSFLLTFQSKSEYWKWKAWQATDFH